MSKLSIALTASVLAVTAAFGSAAEAGFVRLAAPAGTSLVEKAGCGGGGFRAYYRKRVYRSAHRSVRRKVTVAKAQSPKPVSVAKVEEPAVKVEAQTAAAVSENSSIATGAAKIAAVKSPPATSTGSAETAEGAVKKVAAVKDVGCKQFFPSVGLTLSVACD